MKDRPICECLDPSCPCGGECGHLATERLWPLLAPTMLLLVRGEMLCEHCARWALDTCRCSEHPSTLDLRERILGLPAYQHPQPF